MDGTMIPFDEFVGLSDKYNVIPLTATVLADLHTPVSIYLTVKGSGGPSFLFESVEPSERIGRYSFVGIEPAAVIKVHGDLIEILRNGEVNCVRGSIFDIVASKMMGYRYAPVAFSPGFVGGFAGYIGYDCVRDIERIEMPPASPMDEPDALLGLFRLVVAYDHRMQKVTIINNVFLDPPLPLQKQYEEGRKKVEALQLRLRNSVVLPDSFECRIEPIDIDSERERFCQGVKQARRYINDGDIFQVVLSRRVRASFSGNPFAVYRALRVVNPSPYLFYLDFGQTRLIGSSPEVLVRSSHGIAELFPIAGTRRRGTTDEEDKQLEQELMMDEKESAEHVMLVDLGRNDLGRICEYGSVEVPVFKRVERYSHVMHLVSEVRGKIRGGTGPLDVLKACFPAGTVTGAPKIRAMEIITEIEGKRRGVYAGGVGYVGFDGTLDTCIAIRTIVAHRDVLSVQSGAGIVADSDPESEFRETESKARALLDAITHAQNGLKRLGS